jgi:succinoglycan biosynthesis transport protein ExoP
MSTALPSGSQDESAVRGPVTGVLMPPEPARVDAYAAYAPYEEEAHLKDYWRVLVRHRWTVLTFFLVTVVATAAWTFTTRPIYTATATLRIEREAPKVLEFEEVIKADPEDEYYQTQYKILQSRTLANRVIGLLALDQHAEFQELEEANWLGRTWVWFRGQLVRWLPVPPPRPDGTENLAVESPLTRAFKDRLTVAPIRDTRLVNVSFESYQPDLAAHVANTLADAFIAQNLDEKIEATRYATRFLATQMEDARAKLEESEKRLNAFLKSKDILFVDDDERGARPDLITQQLRVLSDALLEARARRIEKESVIAQVRGQNLEALPAVLESDVVARLKEELAKLEGEYRQLGQTFKPEYPRVQRVEQAIEELRRQLAVESRRIVIGLEADYRAALRTEKQLQKRVDEHRGLALRLGDQLAEYRLLRREVDTNQGLHASLLTRLKETSVSSALLTSNLSVVDRAETPLYPSKPRKGLNLLLAAVVGLMGGVGLAFFREYLDTTIKDAKEVQTALRLPTLGVVPSRQALERPRARQRQLWAGEPDPFALVAHTDMTSFLAEAFRNLRTSLLYSSPDHPPRTLMVTSLQPEDGKTSLATNLAIVLGQLNLGEVLVVDGDMRRPRLHELLGVPQAPGLSTFLTGQAELADVIKGTHIPNLSVIPSGQLPLNPAELMSSGRLRQAMDELQKRFAHVIFDAPPLFGVSDALVLAPKVEGVVLVLRHGRSSREQAQRAVAHLASVHARLLGVILNDVDVRGIGYYPGYYGYHGYARAAAGRSGAMES